MSLALLVLLACARASGGFENGNKYVRDARNFKIAKALELPSGCLYNDRWHPDGSVVRTREACLICACARGALSCRRQACAPLPEPPPRCHILHKKGECCPELHCADGARYLSASSSRLDDTVAAPHSTGHACVEGGTVYAAGSAMSSNIACEQCFCLAGARRCVRPKCLPPPEGCQPRPAPGACCPQRYYCQHISTKPPFERNPHDCKTAQGTWVPEGERVMPASGEDKCRQCFCLRGSIRCQNLSCAPTLLGCTPLVQPGQCCPHQYHCDIRKNETKYSNLFNKKDNLLLSLNENRSFHSSKSTKRETTVKVSSTIIDKSTSVTPINKRVHSTFKFFTNMTKPPFKNSTDSALTTAQPSSTTNQTNIKDEVTTKMTPTTVTEYSTREDSSEIFSTELPEKTVKITVNGTINCTTELSSTTLLVNMTNNNDSVWIKSNSEPRNPVINTSQIETHTYAPNEIITNRNINDAFDDNETFTINVTSSLRTNTSHSTTTAEPTTTFRPITSAVPEAVNISKPKKDEPDYDYTEPTLPPSLPNLKIIPFVAADAVVDDDTVPKENPSYSTLKREDKYPVYYHELKPKETYSTRKDVSYNPTQYPIFISKHIETSKYPLTAEAEISNVAYPSLTNDLATSLHEYTVTASLGEGTQINKIEAKIPAAIEDIDARTPTVNLFSPPTKTEGGFIPKDPGVADNYYSVYPSTPPGPSVPHLTTSMQLETKEECVSSDGRRIAEGESINVSCSVCICAWGELHCTPRPCSTPPGCKWLRNATHAHDLCCGELLCEHVNNFTVTTSTTSIPLINLNESSTHTYKYEDIKIANNDSLLFTNINSNKIPIDQSKDSNSTLISNPLISTTIPPFKPLANEKDILPFELPILNNSQPLDYEEEDDDEGFSLGSVLKLLLSDNYDTKTTTSLPPKKLHSTVLPTKKTTRFEPESTFKQTTTSSVLSVNQPEIIQNKFIPMPPPFPYPSPNNLQQNTISRIDHLLLGEATAIKETTPRPMPPTSTILSIVTTRKPFVNKPYTPKTDKLTNKLTSTEANGIGYTSRPSFHSSASMLSSNIGIGLPKLAGCNIYGQMYRVGRIIAELSTPCQECRCTEIGVQCKPLGC